MNKKSSELPALLFADPSSLEQWLEQNHDASPGVRLHIAKKQSDVVTVSYQEALESALCYGWVDSQKTSFDDRTWLQRFTPRSAKSIWSAINKAKAEELIANGRMRPSGFQAIQAAKQNGQWDKAYEAQSSNYMNEDFAIELERNPSAKAFYETLNRQNQYAISFRIHNAKKPETRAKRIQQFVQMLEKGEKIYP